MSSLTSARRAWGDLGRLSRAQRGLTFASAVAPLIAWGCSLPAGAPFSRWTLVAVVVLTLLSVAEPDSQAGLFTVLFLCWYWPTKVPTLPGAATSAWALGASLSLLVFHAATAARATAPGPADFDQTFWWRWLSRVAVVAAGTGGVWGLTAVMASQHPGRDGLTLAAFALVIGATAYARWSVVRNH